jgi:hypothetical protein
MSYNDIRTTEPPYPTPVSQDDYDALAAERDGFKAAWQNACERGDAAVARLAEAERLAREWLETHTSTTDQWDCGAYCCAESILTAITAGSAEVPLTPTGHCAICGGTVGLSHRCVSSTVEAAP